jgi:alpha-N-arabinofuranosidase
MICNKAIFIRAALAAFILGTPPLLLAEMAPASLELDLTQPGAKVSPTFYGLMTEEINHSYDGGLYAELIQNRSFKDDAKTAVHWSLVQDGGGTAAIALDESQPINDALTTCLRLDTGTIGAGRRVGIANEGFWGIPVKPGVTYRASFYARASHGTNGRLMVSIENNAGSTILSLYCHGARWEPRTRCHR